jgi:hypothetical protein
LGISALAGFTALWLALWLDTCAGMHPDVRVDMRAEHKVPLFAPKPNYLA